MEENVEPQEVMPSGEGLSPAQQVLDRKRRKLEKRGFLSKSHWEYIKYYFLIIKWQRQAYRVVGREMKVMNIKCLSGQN